MGPRETCFTFYRKASAPPQGAACLSGFRGPLIRSPKRHKSPSRRANSVNDASVQLQNHVHAKSLYRLLPEGPWKRPAVSQRLGEQAAKYTAVIGIALLGHASRYEAPPGGGGRTGGPLLVSVLGQEVPAQNPKELYGIVVSPQRVQVQHHLLLKEHTAQGPVSPLCNVNRQ